MTPNVAKAMLVTKILVADGIMSEDEKLFLADITAKLGLSDAEKHSVSELDGWDEAEAIIRGWSDDEKRAVIELLVDAASADGRLSPNELAEIKSLELALGLNT